MIVFRGEGHVDPVFEQVLADGEAARVGGGIAFVGNAALAAQTNAVEITPQLEVDDPRDGVRTVNGRVAAGHDVHAFEQFVRNGVGIDIVGARRRRHVTAAVDQHQRAAGAQIAEVEPVDARRTDEAGRVGLGEGRTQRRQFGQRITDIGRAAFGEILTGHGRDRVGRFEVGTRDARTGDDDSVAGGFGAIGIGHLGAIFVELGVARVFGVLRERGRRDGERR